MTITIGSLVNVPAPGDDIRSPWAQDLTKLAVHPFATKPALDAAIWPGLANGAMAVTVDTGLLWERIGGMWWAGNRTLARIEATSNIVVTTAGMRWGAFAPIVFPPNRRIEVYVRASLSGAGTGIVAFAEADTFTTPGTPIAAVPRLVSINGLPGAVPGAAVHGAITVIPNAGSHQFGIWWTCAAGTFTQESATDRGVAEIRDVGPANPVGAFLLDELTELEGDAQQLGPGAELEQLELVGPR